MVFVYIVRCNFTEPAKEQAWNAWYSGPKIEQMLAKPYFRTCQRFRLASGTGRNYLALWTVQSPAAFETVEYTSDWGFSDWAPYITDWSRDLFDGGAASERALSEQALSEQALSEQALAVAPTGLLHTVSFDGVDEADAQAARALVAKSEPDMMWLPVVGLDRHTPLIGLRPLSDPSAFRASDHGRTAGMQEALYRPLCHQYER
jgi:hypothetical protein